MWYEKYKPKNQSDFCVQRFNLSMDKFQEINKI